MIDERFKGILFGTYPNTWVKDDDNSYRITKTQGQYIGAITNKVGSCNFSKPLCCNVENTCTCTRGKYIYIGTKKKIFYRPTTKNVANFSPYGEMMSQGVYITAGGVAKKIIFLRRRACNTTHQCCRTLVAIQMSSHGNKRRRLESCHLTIWNARLVT